MKKEDKIELKKAEIEAKLAENEVLKNDLQRTRADFENYRKNTEIRVSSAQTLGQKKAVLALLPMIDDIERAINHLPSELVENTWAQNVIRMNKNLEKNLEKLNVKRIPAEAGTVFDPEFHEAVQFDEESEGEEEVIAEELRAGYSLNEEILRPAMVKVARRELYFKA